MKKILIILFCIISYNSFSQTFGCTDSLALNYDSLATDDDGSCLYCNSLANFNSDTISACDSIQINVINISGATYSWNSSNIYSGQNAQYLLDIGYSPYQVFSMITSPPSTGTINSLYECDFQGGYLFYLDTVSKEGLIAAFFDEPQTSWGFGCIVGNSNGISTSDSLFTGQVNTNLILSGSGLSCSYPNIAAAVCNNSIQSGYTDWFLPSSFEVNIMYDNLFSSPNFDFANDFYWSSTEDPLSLHIDVKGRNFINGLVQTMPKDHVHSVRPVRKFLNSGSSSFSVLNPGWNSVTMEWLGCVSTDSIYVNLYCYGCTDSSASNYDSFATLDDGSCVYCTYGCTDLLAFNYDSLATCDDGSCIYCISTDSIFFNYTGSVQTYVVPSNVNSVTIKAYGAEGGGRAITGNSYSGLGGLGGYSVGDLTVIPGDILNIYVGGHGLSENWYGVAAGGWNGGGSGHASSIGEPGNGGGGASDVRLNGDSLIDRVIVAGGGGGGGEDWGDIYGDGGGFQGTNSYYPGTQTGPGSGGGLGFGGSTGFGDGGGGGGGYYGGGTSFGFSLGNDTEGGGGGSSFIGGVTNASTIEAQRSGDGLVVIYYDVICFYGCTDSSALNYDSLATVDDGSCIYCVYGCIDPSSISYDSLATCDDGSCLYAGCTNPCACYYNPLATIDDGSCFSCSLVEGCTDPLAANYDSTVCYDDGSCTYCFSYLTPNNISSNWVTDTKAGITWDNMNDSACMVWKYYVRYREVGTPTWTTKSAGVGNGLCNFGLNTTTKTLQNLTSSTTYEYKMKAFYCGGTESNYSAPSQFTTAADCPPMTNLTATTFNGNQAKVRFDWDTTGAYVFARVALRVDTAGANWQTAGGFGVYYPTLHVNKFGLQPGESYRAQGRTFCDSNITSYRSWWTSPIFWTQPGTIRLNGGKTINNLDVYPNPTNDIFNVSFVSEEIQSISIRVLNIVGEVIYEESLDQFVGEYTKQISLGDYSKGIYFLEINNDKGTINKKIILQ